MPPVRLCWSSRSSALARPVPRVEHELVIDRPLHLGSAPDDEIRIEREWIDPHHLLIEPRVDGVWLRGRRAARLDGAQLFDREARLPEGGGVVSIGGLEIALRGEAAVDGALEGSAAMRALLEEAPRDRDLLIEGELGSGRRALARAIHERDRPGRPFVVVDCSTVEGYLIEIVLFGMEMRGNPPPPRPADIHYWGGVIAAAGAGTLVLAEIGALPLEVQPWLAAALAQRPPTQHRADHHRVPFSARVIATASGDRPLLPELAAQLVPQLAPAGPLRVPPLRERAAELGPLLRALGGGEPGPAMCARLARLRWPRNTAQLRGVGERIARDGAEDAVAEAELLEAIEDEPAADAPRLVYGDLLAGRGDPRGELIQVQCRLADPATPAGARRGLAARERELLDAHAEAWTAPVIAGARVKAAALSRGFVEAVRADCDVLYRLDVLFALVPLVRELHLDPARGPDPGRGRFASPQLARVEVLRASCAEPVNELADELAGCGHLGRVRTLAFSATAEVARAPVYILSGAGAGVLAGSRHLAGVTSLMVDGGLVSAAALAVVLGPAAWTLRRLVLERLLLGDGALEALAGAPGVRRLEVLVLSAVPLGDAAVPALGRLRGLGRLELRGCGLSRGAAARLAEALGGVEVVVA